MQSIKDKVIKKIKHKGKGFCFSVSDFFHFGSRDVVSKALIALVSENVIRRVARGLYDYPRVNDELGGQLAPDITQVAKAIARKKGWKIQPSGAWAANLLGLSSQVPAQIVYLTDGRSQTFSIDNRTITYTRVPPKTLLPGSEIGALITQALRHVGRDHVDDEIIDKLQHIIPATDKKRLLKDTQYMEAWIHEAVKRIVAETVL